MRPSLPVSPLCQASLVTLITPPRGEGPGCLQACVWVACTTVRPHRRAPLPAPVAAKIPGSCEPGVTTCMCCPSPLSGPRLCVLRLHRRPLSHTPKAVPLAVPLESCLLWWKPIPTARLSALPSPLPYLPQASAQGCHSLSPPRATPRFTPSLPGTPAPGAPQFSSSGPRHAVSAPGGCSSLPAGP